MSLDIYNKAGASDEVPVFVFLIICFRIGKMFCARGFSMFLRALYSFLDEVQLCKGFEAVLNGLNRK
jgi:hypothetical protein